MLQSSPDFGPSVEAEENANDDDVSPTMPDPPPRANRTAFSAAENATLTCPGCDRPFNAEVWLIVDTVERPDLVARLASAIAAHVACPHCGNSGQFDVPLLLYRPDADPTILFSPAQQTSEEDDRQQAVGLIGRLRRSLGADWRDEWVADGIQCVPRNVLPAC